MGFIRDNVLSSNVLSKGEVIALDADAAPAGLPAPPALQPSAINVVHPSDDMEMKKLKKLKKKKKKLFDIATPLQKIIAHLKVIIMTP